jgi:ABC-type uncharacterized transport system substrate-binding protein
VKRRDFITLLGGAAAAWPLAARAQQAAMPVIGFVNAGSPKGYARPLSAFLKGLGQAGYVEGRNVTIEYRWAEGQYDRLPAFVADFVQRNVNVIAGTSTQGGLAAKAAAATIPVVFTTSGDPVRLGFVTSLSRPDGNITGAAQLNVEVAPKRLELIREVLPSAVNVVLLTNPTSALTEPLLRELRTAAATLRLKLHVLQASSEQDLTTAFAALAQLRADALVIGTDAFFTSRSGRAMRMVRCLQQRRGWRLSSGDDLSETHARTTTDLSLAPSARDSLMKREGRVSGDWPGGQQASPRFACEPNIVFCCINQRIRKASGCRLKCNPPKTRHQNWPSETAGRRGACIAQFRTRRPSLVLCPAFGRGDHSMPKRLSN